MSKIYSSSIFLKSFLKFSSVITFRFFPRVSREVSLETLPESRLIVYPRNASPFFWWILQTFLRGGSSSFLRDSSSWSCWINRGLNSLCNLRTFFSNSLRHPLRSRLCPSLGCMHGKHSRFFTADPLIYQFYIYNKCHILFHNFTGIISQFSLEKNKIS